MDMIATLGWIFFVLAAIVAAVGFAGQTEPKKRLTESEAKQAELIAALNEARKQPIASVSGGAAAVAYPVAKLPGVNKQNAVNVAEIKRLEAAVAEAQKQVRAEHARAEAAASRVVSAEAMVVQARSKATEAGHNALQEARKETESVRARLAEAEQHLANTAAPVAASADTERTNVLQAETASLQAQLRDAEARAEDTARHAERALREQFEARLRAAKHAFDTELENRVGLVREQFEAQQQRLLQEIETAKQAIATAAPPPLAEQAPPIRPRTRITPSIPSAETQTNEKPIVILADTDANACQLITKHLEAGGYAVRAVQSIADAVQAARDTPPVALALDGANLPDGDCWQLLAMVKEDADLKEIPVLVFAPGKDRERAMEMGAAGCFTKPVDKAVLVATIKAAMVKRKQRARLAAVSGGTVGVRRTSLLTTPTQ